jgi:hypothetical protein
VSLAPFPQCSGNKKRKQCNEIEIRERSQSNQFLNKTKALLAN